MTIVDAVAADNDEALLGDILAGLPDVLKEKGTSVIHMITLHADSSLSGALKRNGFVSFRGVEKIVRKLARNPASVLMANVLDEKLDAAKVYEPANWYFTDILSEGR